MTASEAPAAVDVKAASPAKPARWRRLVPPVLLGVFCLSTVLTLVTVWAQNQIDDTDRYVRTVSPLAEDPAIQAAVVDRVTARVGGALAEIQAREPLVDRERYLAAPLALLVEQYVRQTVQSFVASERFPVLWEQISRASHPAVAAVLTGESTERFDATGGQITLDLAPLVTEILARLGERGVDIAGQIQVDQLDTSLVIVESDGLAQAQDFFGLLDRLAFVFPLLALLSFGGYVGLSRDRWQAVTWSGVGLAVAMAVFLLLLAFGRRWYLDGLDPEVNVDAVTAFFDTIGRYVRQAARLLAILGLVVAGVAAITRPGGWARRVRASARGRSATAWRDATATWSWLARSAAWADGHRRALAVALAVGCCLVVVSWDRMSLGWAGTVLVVAVVGFGALLLLHPVVEAATVASPGLTPAYAGNGTAVVGHAPLGDGNRAAVPAAPGPRTSSGSGLAVAPALTLAGAPPATDEARAALVALAGELSADDVQILRRLAGALRDSA